VIYNTGQRYGKLIEPPTQEEIYNMPEYFALSREEIYAHDGCPSFLKRILDQFPWDGRNNVLQVRPQDFRKAKPALLGDHWHIDIMVRLNDGHVRVAKSLDEFHLMVCSWGDVVETEFIATPLDLPDLNDPSISHMDFFHEVNRRQFEIRAPKPGQLVEYTSKDIHRMGPNIKLGNLRLMIVAFDTDSVGGSGLILPSIRDKDDPSEAAKHLKFRDYVR
jgi:hypothetical protein